MTTKSISLSTDGGATWFDSGAPSTNWSGLALSADGNRLIAAANGGGIYVRQATPNPPLKIQQSSPGVAVRWGIPSLPFVLQQNSDLATTNWTDVAARPALDYNNLEYEVTVPALGNPVFYRLNWTPPP